MISTGIICHFLEYYVSMQLELQPSYRLSLRDSCVVLCQQSHGMSLYKPLSTVPTSLSRDGPPLSQIRMTLDNCTEVEDGN